MKKTNVFGMIGLTAALIFGAAACKQEANSQPSAKNVSDVIADGEDLSGKWKLTDGYVYVNYATEDSSVENPILVKFETIEDIAEFAKTMLSIDFDDEFCVELENEDLKRLGTYIDKMKAALDKNKSDGYKVTGNVDGHCTINEEHNEINFYFHRNTTIEGEIEMNNGFVKVTEKNETQVDLTFTKQ